MSNEIRVNRGAQPQQSAPFRQEMQPEQEPMQPSGSGGSSKMPWVILAVIVIVIAVLGILFRDKLFKGSGSGDKMTAIKSAEYQAVFLTNGQVYFGKISNVNGNYVNLEDIYYLQVGPQQGSGTEAAPAPQQAISLVKLGNELHGPVDEMHISRSQILFYEDLKADGSVVKAIEAYKANPAQ